MDNKSIETDCSVKSYVSVSWTHNNVGDVHYARRVTAS